MLLTWRRDSTLHANTFFFFYVLLHSVTAVTQSPPSPPPPGNGLSCWRDVAFSSPSSSPFPHLLTIFSSTSFFLHPLLMGYFIDFSAHKMLQCSLKEENPFENGVNCQNHPRYPSSPVPAISGFVLLAVVSQYFTETVSPAGLIPIGNLGVHAYFMLFLKVNLNKSFLSLQRNSFRRASCAKARVRELSWQALAVYLWECF